MEGCMSFRFFKLYLLVSKYFILQVCAYKQKPDRIDCTLSIPPDIIETSELVIEHLFFIRYFNWIIQAQFFFDEQPVANIRVQQKHIVIIRAQVCVLKESR